MEEQLRVLYGVGGVILCAAVIVYSVKAIIWVMQTSERRQAYWVVRNHHLDRLEVVQGYVPSVMYEAGGTFARQLRLLQTRVDGPFYDSADAVLKLQWWAEQQQRKETNVDG